MSKSTALMYVSYALVWRGYRPDIFYHHISLFFTGDEDH